MRRLLLTAVAATLAASPLHAQLQVEAPAPTRVRVTPFVGTTLPLGVSGTYFVGDTSVAFEQTGAASALAGVELEVPVRGSFSVVGTGSASTNGNITVDVRTATQRAGFLVQGPSALFARLGLRYRLPEPNPDTRRFRPAGFLTIAPGVMRQDYGDDLAGGGTETSFGLSLGAEAITRIAESRFSLYLGADNFVALTGEGYTRQVFVVSPDAEVIEAGARNTLSLRLGVTYSR